MGAGAEQPARLIGDAAAVLICTPASPVTVKAHMALYLQWGDLDEIRRTQASNLQTIGHALAQPADPAWLTAPAGSPAVRFVPLMGMHDFGPVWDGGLLASRAVPGSASSEGAMTGDFPYPTNEAFGRASTGRNRPAR